MNWKDVATLGEVQDRCSNDGQAGHPVQILEDEEHRAILVCAETGTRLQPPTVWLEWDCACCDAPLADLVHPDARSRRKAEILTDPRCDACADAGAGW